MCINFDEVIFIMNAASFAKVNACLTKADWNENSVREALTSTDLNVGDIHFHSKDGKLEYATFNCIASFVSNEIPGILAPFFCCMYVEAAFDEKTNQYRTDGGCGPTGMISPIDGETIYGVDGLYNEFRKDKPQLDISLFVSESFDFESVCKELGCNSVVCFNAEDIFYNDEGFMEQPNIRRLEVIKVVKFSDFMIPTIGAFMDEYFKKEGWELQYVKGHSGCTGYQVFFGPGVQVDNNYEYGFPYLYDCDEVVAFAEYFYIHRSADKGTEDLQ